MHKLSEGKCTPEQREEYRQLIRAIGQRYIRRTAANHIGMSETARALGISYTTLKARLRPDDDPNASMWVSTEQLMAARYLWEHPTDGWVKAADLIPEPPTIPKTMTDKIITIVRDSSRSLTVEEIHFMLKRYYNIETSKKTVANRLGDLLDDDVPMVERVGRGMYRTPEWVT